MSQFDLLLAQVEDPVIRDNFRKIIEFLGANPVRQDAFQACELNVTANATGLTIKHKLGQVPKDCIVTRLIAPSAARLVIDYAEFTNEEVSFDVSGLASGEKLHARVLVGTLQDVVTLGDDLVIEDPTQQARGKF